ncbi:VOC family protein [Herbiconiux solani]|uniref:VOC family protein n=1 Tax=Herbiconiux solani TaxID=661329 RepID=UPI0008265FD3|nr:VOC family protein [Herbiconiux solani]
MIGSLDVIVLDCPDTRALARFYAELIGGEIVQFDTHWAEVVPPIPGSRPLLAFQRVDDYRAPEWPGQQVPQQLHLDVKVDDLDAGEQAVLAIGATRVGGDGAQDAAGDSDSGDDGDGEVETFRVFLDPAGHPFCLVRPND